VPASGHCGWHVLRRLQEAYNAEPATYSAEGFDAAKIILDAISEGKTTREDIVEYVKTYDKPGVTKQLKFDDKGEPSDITVWAYKVAAARSSRTRRSSDLVRSLTHRR
jgi:ABC-type branched-subunit amino acid transport system substrate-binding protein